MRIEHDSIWDDVVPEEVKRAVTERAAARMTELKAERRRARKEAFSKNWADGTRLIRWVVVFTAVLFTIMLFIPHARAENSLPTTILVPEKMDIHLPSVAIVVGSSGNVTNAKRLIGDFKKHGMVVAHNVPTQSIDCRADVLRKEYLLTCTIRGQNEKLCTLGPSSVPRKWVVGFLESYVRGCALNGIVTRRLYA